MRVVRWNVNGIRACVRHGFVGFVDRSATDIVGVQEVRAQPENIPPAARRSMRRRCWASTYPRPITSRAHGVASISTSRFAAPPRVPACLSSSTARDFRLWARVHGPP